jgi:hypothetical protein
MWVPPAILMHGYHVIIGLGDAHSATCELQQDSALPLENFARSA